MASQFNPQQINSTTFADVVSLQMGLTRIPGESAANFLDRLYSAASSRRDHSLEGTINEICFQLGLSSYFGILIQATDPTTVFQSRAGSVVITDSQGSVTIPTVSIDSDNYWNWLFLSDVVAAINAQSRVQATLISGTSQLTLTGYGMGGYGSGGYGGVTFTGTIVDKPAYVLAPQSSLNFAIAEPATKVNNQLAHGNIVVGSERFNLAVPQYTLSPAGNLVFSSAPPAKTAITYSYNPLPYQVTCSDVSLINLLDPAFQSLIVGSDGGLVHQMKEYVQDLLTQDPCYWGK